jgi:hypothetical protein
MCQEWAAWLFDLLYDVCVCVCVCARARACMHARTGVCSLKDFSFNWITMTNQAQTTPHVDWITADLRP